MKLVAADIPRNFGGIEIEARRGFVNLDHVRFVIKRADGDVDLYAADGQCIGTTPSAVFTQAIGGIK